MPVQSLNAPRMPARRSVLSFFRGSNGSLMTWAAFLMVPIIGFVGLGVDTARGYLVRARLSQALDSAGLAAGRWTYSTAKATEEAEMVFKANFPTNFMDSTVTGPTIKFQNLSTGNDLITVKASAVLPTYFARVVGVDTFTVSAKPKSPARRSTWTS